MRGKYLEALILVVHAPGTVQGYHSSNLVSKTSHPELYMSIEQVEVVQHE